MVISSRFNKSSFKEVVKAVDYFHSLKQLMLEGARPKLPWSSCKSCILTE